MPQHYKVKHINKHKLELLLVIIIILKIALYNLIIIMNILKVLIKHFIF